MKSALESARHSKHRVPEMLFYLLLSGCQWTGTSPQDAAQEIQKLLKQRLPLTFLSRSINLAGPL